MSEQIGQMARAGELTRDAVLALSARHAEPAWMRAFRLAAWEAFERLPWPAASDEEWRRTDPGVFRLEGARPGGEAPGGALPADLQRAAAAWEAPAGLLVQRNSVTVRASLDGDLARRGIVFTDLHTALREHPDLLRQHFMTACVKPEETKFRALHAALWNGGGGLYLPPGVEGTPPPGPPPRTHAGGPGVFPHPLVIARRGRPGPPLRRPG